MAYENHKKWYQKHGKYGKIKGIFRVHAAATNILVSELWHQRVWVQLRKPIFQYYCLSLKANGLDMIFDDCTSVSLFNYNILSYFWVKSRYSEFNQITVIIYSTNIKVVAYKIMIKATIRNWILKAWFWEDKSIICQHQGMYLNQLSIR